MKKLMIGMCAVLVSQSVFAGEVYCGANVETIRGSSEYNKNIFFQKIDTSKAFAIYLLKDGSTLKVEDMKTPEAALRLKQAHKLIFITPVSDGRLQLGVGDVVVNVGRSITTKNPAFAMSSAKDAMLIANGVSLACTEGQ